MSIASDEMARRALDAALTLFARHGFKRTSMADVAAEAGIARATLYLRFRDKRALIDALAASMVSAALAAAEAAWADGAGVAANLEAMLLAKDLTLFRILRGSPHGAELMAADAELTRAHARRLGAGFVALLTRRAEALAAEGADFSAFDGPAGLAGLLAAAGAGLKHEAADEAEYRDAVRRLCAVAAKAARPG